MTSDEQANLARLTTVRSQSAKNLDRARGLTGNGAEQAYVVACEAEIAYAHSVGLIGMMRPKQKWSKR